MTESEIWIDDREEFPRSRYDTQQIAIEDADAEENENLTNWAGETDHNAVE